MEKLNFKNLLIDLYNIYNPANIQYIDDLVEKYNRLEFDAIRNIFLKYNRKNTSFYDPKAETDEYIYNLIKEYESGKRTLENINLDKIFLEKTEEQNRKENEEKKIKEENEKKRKQEVKEEVTDEINKKIKTIEDSFKEKEISIKNSLQKIYEDFEKKLISLRENEEDIVIRIFSTYSNSELNLPNKKTIASLGKGARLIIKDENNQTIGLEVVDIIYDGISEINNKPLVEIFLGKTQN